VPWLGGPGRLELAFNGIFDPPKVRARRAPRLALPGRCERLTIRSHWGAARPVHPVGWPWQSSFSHPASGWSVHRTATSGGPGAAFPPPPKVHSRPPPSNSAPNPPFHTRTDPLPWLSRAGTTHLSRRSAVVAAADDAGGPGGVGRERRTPRAASAARGRAARRVPLAWRFSPPPAPNVYVRMRVCGVAMRLQGAPRSCGIGQGVFCGRAGAG